MMPVDEWDKDGVQLHKAVRLDGVGLDPVTRARLEKELTERWTFEQAKPGDKPLWQWSDDVLEMMAMREQTAKDDAKAAGRWQWSDKALAARDRYEHISGHKPDWELMARERGLDWESAGAESSAKASAKTEWWPE